MLRIIKKLEANQLLHLIPFLLILASLSNCKKEEEPRIEVLNLESVSDMFERDTIKIEYYVTKQHLDSVCLLIDDQIRQTQRTAENTLIFIPDCQGACTIQMRLVAFYHSGIARFSETYFVNVINLYTPVLDYIINRDDGLSTYFVGEKLSITVKAAFDHENLNEFKQISFYLNDDSIGTKTLAPYTFITNVISKEQNQSCVILKDLNNRLHYVKRDLTIPINTPPEIRLESDYRHNIPPGYFFTSDSVITVLNGSDNLKISNIDYYLDDKLFVKKQINADRIVYLPVSIGKLSTGTHKTYCIAFDDRGMSTKSNTLTIQVYKDIDLNTDICDVEYSDQPGIVFLLSNSKLFVINPILENVTSIIDLPFSDAKSMDFLGTENTLYIASEQGRLFTWNSMTQILNEVMLTGITNIEDIEIDNDHNLVLLSNNKILVINLPSGKKINTRITLDPGSTLIFEKSQKLIIAGGNPQVSSSYIYLFQLGTDTLIYKKKSDIGGFGNRLQLNPIGNDFCISFKPRDNRTLINTYNTSNLSLYRTYQQQNASVNSYSSDGNSFFIINNWDCILDIYDTKGMFKMKSFPIPVGDHDYLNFLIPNINNTRLVITTMNVFTPRVKIVFIRLD